jgi:hypothetical protein
MRLKDKITPYTDKKGASVIFMKLRFVGDESKAVLLPPLV